MPRVGWRNPAKVERTAMVIEMYRAGAPLAEILAKCDLTLGSINYVVRRAGLPRRRQKRPAPKTGGRRSLGDEQLSMFFPAAAKDDEAGRRERHIQRRRQRRVQDNERIRAVEKVRLARPDVQIRTAEQQARYRQSPAGRYRIFVTKAKHRKIDNELTLEQWLEITDKPCVYCGSDCLEGTCNGYGIDRVDSTIGYMLENSVPCCVHCNIMKHRLCVADFLSHVQKIVAHQATINTA